MAAPYFYRCDRCGHHIEPGRSYINDPCTRPGCTGSYQYQPPAFPPPYQGGYFPQAQANIWAYGMPVMTVSFPFPFPSNAQVAAPGYTYSQPEPAAPAPSGSVAGPDGIIGWLNNVQPGMNPNSPSSLASASLHQEEIPDATASINDETSSINTAKSGRTQQTEKRGRAETIKSEYQASSDRPNQPSGRKDVRDEGAFDSDLWCLDCHQAGHVSGHCHDPAVVHNKRPVKATLNIDWQESAFHQSQTGQLVDPPNMTSPRHPSDLMDNLQFLVSFFNEHGRRTAQRDRIWREAVQIMQVAAGQEAANAFLTRLMTAGVMESLILKEIRLFILDQVLVVKSKVEDRVLRDENLKRQYCDDAGKLSTSSAMRALRALPPNEIVSLSHEEVDRLKGSVKKIVDRALGAAGRVHLDLLQFLSLWRGVDRSSTLRSMVKHMGTATLQVRPYDEREARGMHVWKWPSLTPMLTELQTSAAAEWPKPQELIDDETRSEASSSSDISRGVGDDDAPVIEETVD